MFVVNFKLSEFKKGIIQLSSWIADPLLKTGEVLATNLDLRTYAKAREEAQTPPPPPSVNHVLSETVTDLTATFDVVPNCDGSLDFGDASTVFTWTATTTAKTHDYATAGTYTAVFTPTDTNDTGSSVTVIATAPVPPSVNHVLSATVADLRATFNVAPNCAGSLDYGDGSAVFGAWINTTTNKTHDYATAGTYTAVFTPTDTNDTGSSKTVTVTDPVVPFADQAPASN